VTFLLQSGPTIDGGLRTEPREFFASVKPVLYQDALPVHYVGDWGIKPWWDCWKLFGLFSS
jgi:hypothetical protein